RYVVGSDGSRGPCRAMIPETTRQRYFHEYPFAWFGILCEAPPSHEVLIYSRSERGFALISQRSDTVQRMYFQTSPDTDVTDWSDDRTWTDLHSRLARRGQGPQPRLRRRLRARPGPDQRAQGLRHRGSGRVFADRNQTCVEGPELLLPDDPDAPRRPRSGCVRDEAQPRRAPFHPRFRARSALPGRVLHRMAQRLIPSRCPQ